MRRSIPPIETNDDAEVAAEAAARRRRQAVAATRASTGAPVTPPVDVATELTTQQGSSINLGLKVKRHEEFSAATRVAPPSVEAPPSDVPPRAQSLLPLGIPGEMPIPTPILPENSTATITPQDQTPQPSSGVLEPANLGFGEAGDRAGFNQAPFAQPGESAPVEPQKHSRQTDKAQHDIILSPVVNISEFGSLRLDRITKAKSSSSKKEELEQGVRLTEQRPAAYRFGMRGEKLDVLPEPPKLEDRQFALDIYEELNAKARELRERLTRTNSASRVCNSVERLVSALGTRFDDLRPGILLSRARSIEADRTAFDNEEARGELFADAFAMMDDTLQTLRDLLAASPIVRRIEAERLALDLDRNANAVPIIQRQMDAIKVAAEKSGAATEAAISALAQNDAAIEDATTQVELTGLVADKLLVFANFVRAVIGGTASYGRSALTKGGSELAGFGGDIWKAIRVGLPPGVELAATLAPSLALIGLAVYLTHPVTGIAAVVKNFKPMAQTLKRLARDAKPAKDGKRPRGGKKRAKA